MIQESPLDRLSSKMSTPDTPPPLVGGHALQFQLLFWLVGLWVNIFKNLYQGFVAWSKQSKNVLQKFRALYGLKVLDQQRKMHTHSEWQLVIRQVAEK